MALFQPSVLKKYLKQQDQAAVDKAYKAYTKYFLHPTVQENIRSSKEEQFQATFLNELFVNILGYTLNPSPNYNLTTELKNEKGAKKADGAILNADGKATTVIELKGTKTKDLESIRQQAFDYKANHTDCVYVVTSNFEKLRFYIHNAVEFEEFNLFMLSPDRFALLYLCLHKDNILNGIPEKIKNDSVVAEESITKKFYADYSVFKRELYRDLVKRNMKNDVFRKELSLEDAERGQKNIKLTLFKKSQKLIDRFLFIFFAEDRGLLPPNSITLIINKYKQLQELDRAEPLYDTYKVYFKYLDTGRAGTDKNAEIFAYNGGLFKPDATLDSLLISDDLLLKHTSKLTAYDFESQVDVNILGHIFENSLNEIESVNAEIEGTEFDKQKTKRKKDGVFYTPKYITKYIVDNTVGKLCEEKKTELKLVDDEYHKGRKNRQKKTLEDLLAKLDEYREWLLSLTICDPACGSGAFLNQALDFLIKEHTYIDELKQALLGGALVLSDIENTILERNIYGVDLNEESVEIAKLSLWLRTAQPRRKLNSLNNNIKCGNSLIDSKAVAGDKAFHWETEFPEVFAAGGFDVVIGNPPYVRQELFKEIKPYLKTNYKCYNSVADLYTYFIEKGIDLMYKSGKFSFILPNKFLKASYGKEIRNVILNRTQIDLLFDFDDYPVFQDATTYPIIYVLDKEIDNSRKDFIYSAINKRVNTLDPIATLSSQSNLVPYKSLGTEMWNFISTQSFEIISKIKRNSVSLSKFVDKAINRGVLTGKNDVFIFGKETKVKLENESNSNELIKPILLGSAIKRYSIEPTSDYLLFTRRGIDINDYPRIREYLKPFYNELRPRNNGEKIGRKAGPYKWFEIQDNIAYFKDFEQAKIVYPRTNNQCNFQLDLDGHFISDNNFYIKSSNKSLLGILNSKLIFFYLTKICTTLQGGYYDFRRDKIDTIPLPITFKEEISDLTICVDIQILNHTNHNSIKASFLTYLQSQFPIEKPSKKLQKWYELEFGEFTTELAKVAKKGAKEQGIEYTSLTKLQEMDWMEVFTTKKAEAQTLKAEIDKTDREIDQMVYELYGLTEEEIAIVENS